MPRQLTFSDVAAQQTLSEASAPTADTVDDDSQLREDGDLDPLSSIEWLVQLLPDADSD